MPCYDFTFGSYEGMVVDNAYESLKALRKVNPICFNRGTIIHIQITSYLGYDTFFIGSTDVDYFRILCISFYGNQYFAKYEAGNWSERQFIVTETQ